MWWCKFTWKGAVKYHSLKVRDRTVAGQRLRAVEDNLDKGIHPFKSSAGRSATIKEILDAYSEAGRYRKKPLVIKNDRGRLENFFTLSNITHISQVTKETVETYLKSRLDADKGKTFLNHKDQEMKLKIGLIQANNIITTIKNLVKFSAQKGYLAIDRDKGGPLDDLKHYRVDELHPAFLTIEEIDRVIKAAKNEKIYPMLMMDIYTGCRPSELKQLAWDDVDLKNKTLTFRFTKGKRSKTLPILPELEPFITPGNIPIKIYNIQRPIRRIRKSSGVPRLTFKILRHSLASHLVMNGVDLFTVSKILGHSSIKVTEKHYAHLSQGHIRESLARLPYGDKIGDTSKNKKTRNISVPRR